MFLGETGRAPQGTAQWKLERAGYATASCFAYILAQPKQKGAKESTSRRNYRIKLVTERLTNAPLPETFRNVAMDWGNLVEADARRAAEALGYIIFRSPFVQHPTHKWVGCSPDGVIEPDGLCQIKCPYVSSVHIDTIESGVPHEHIAQIQGEMWVTGRKWSLFVSYDPRMPEHLQTYARVVHRDNEYIGRLEKEVLRFLEEVHTAQERLAVLKLAK